MTRMKAALAVLAVAALLSGCSAAVEAPSAGRTAPAVAETATPEPTATVEPTAAPVTIEPTATPNPEFNGFASQEDWYLRGLAGALSGKPPSDDDLIGAGMLACEQLRSGVALADVRVVSGAGELADQDNRNIVGQATQVYCPEFY
jgi:PBP1b-binding outer membrane lipoprotein LpoB